MDYAALIVAGVTVIFSAGLYVAAQRQTRRDVNGIGHKVRDVATIEDRHHREILSLMLREPDARERAKLIAEMVEKG